MITYKSKSKKGYNRFYVYKITNPCGCFYIGATTNIEHRVLIYREYIKTFKNQTNLYTSIVKYGWAAHKIEILYEYCGSFDLSFIKNIEMGFIKKYYNISPSKSLNSIIQGLSKDIALRKKEI